MRTWIAAIAVVFVIAGTSNAHAQGAGSFKGFLTGHVGAIRGGDISSARATFGASVAVNDDTGWGAEIDLGHTNDAVSGRQILDVTSYMVNAIWITPHGLVRPFGIAGAGVLQVHGCDAPCTVPARTYDFGMDAGAGAFLMLTDVAGFRADARYVFSSADHVDLHRPDNFGYWRVSIGATFSWAIAP
ncbi:MAG TPA: hypothetical protein VM096_19520 [Vicinamibacterales bacterium]|nr:hypothetical protein [Vicinamibacterales bacterium]